MWYFKCQIWSKQRIALHGDINKMRAMNNCGPFLLNRRWRRFSEDQTMIFKANRSFVLRHCKEMVTVSPALYFVFSQSKNLATKKWQFVSRWRHNGITIAMHHPNWTALNNKLQHWIKWLTVTTHQSLKYAAAVFFLFLFLMTLLMSGERDPDWACLMLCLWRQELQLPSVRDRVGPRHWWWISGGFTL